MSVKLLQKMMQQIRLYCNQHIAINVPITLTREQKHYLEHVMRVRVGDRFYIFNEHDGQFLVELKTSHKQQSIIHILEQTHKPQSCPFLGLIFAPIKRGHLDDMIAKATEIGVTHFLPIITRFTQVKALNKERLTKIMIEAAELSERFDIPLLNDIAPLKETLKTLAPDAQLIFCDEAREAAHITSINKTHPKRYILIGPEGGFHEEERAYIKRLPHTTTISLGSRIMRADTAALFTLSYISLLYNQV